MRGQERLKPLLRKASKVLILGHQNADPDAVCSAYALSGLLRRLQRGLKTELASPEGASKISKQVLQRLDENVSEQPDPGQCDLIFTVDTNTLQQLGPLKLPVEAASKPIIVIDHHAPHPDTVKAARLVLCDQQATSACEVVLELCRNFRSKPSKKEAFALLTGLIFETGHFSIANAKTVKAACELVDYGANIQEAMELLRFPMDESERIARIKGAQRIRVEKVGGWIVAVSSVGSYHASAARALIGLGAQVAIVGGDRKEELTLSFRATKEFHEKSGVHLGTDVAKPLGAKMDGMGGGHATAAGANIKGDLSGALDLALQLLSDALSRRPEKSGIT